jgi:hypothetical protein
MSGIAYETLNKLKLDYPSLTPINNHCTKTSIGAVVLSLPGVYSHNNSSIVNYRIIIDFRHFPASKPMAYVLTPDCSKIRHCNIYTADKFSIAPNRMICAVCEGFDSDSWDEVRGTNEYLVGVYLDQLLSALKNPNPDDYARCIE